MEASLDGTLIIISNTDQPGVIGGIENLLGQYHVNIAAFALGRNDEYARCAIGVVNVDEHDYEGIVTEEVLRAIRAIPAIQSA